MRVAIISSCALPTPPLGYGGTELVVGELANTLPRLGHEVTVYATGDSRPGVELRYRFERPIWPPNVTAELAHSRFAWDDIRSRRHPFDVIHTHVPASLALAPDQADKTVITLHTHRDQVLVDYYGDFPDVTYVAISKRQADLVPELSIDAVVHHGLDPSLYPLGAGAGGYAAFLGRLAPEKAPHVAIEAARAAGVPLTIGGAPQAVTRDYFDREVAPRLSWPGLIWLGEVSHAPKVRLLQDARALLFPIDWEEPFGLVMIESMFVGTPVIAFPRGSVTEVVDEGVTGWIVNDASEMAARLACVATFDRRRCRERAIARFCAMRMSRDYEAVYARVLERRTARRRGPIALSPGRAYPRTGAAIRGGGADD